MDIVKIEELIKVLESSQSEELSVRKGDISVYIRKGRHRKVPAPAAHKPKDQSAPTVEAKEKQAEDCFILAPMVGIFHAVNDVTQVGAQISKGQVVGAIESMKLLNDVVSEVSGTVKEVMVEDGMPVEYGQPLCRVEVDSK
jgi:biotin carboxyl carrier protein